MHLWLISQVNLTKDDAIGSPKPGSCWDLVCL